MRRVRGLGERHHLHSLVHLSSEPKAAFKAEVEPLFPPFSLRLRAQKVEELWRLLSVMPPYFCRPEITRVRRQGLIAVCPVRGGSGSRVHCPRVLLAAAAFRAVAASPLLSLFACSSIRPRQAGGEILQKGLVLPLPKTVVQTVRMLQCLSVRHRGDKCAVC